MKNLALYTVMVVFVVAGQAMTASAEEKQQALKKQLVWKIDNLEKIGGLKPKVLGEPKVIATEAGKAVEFDGKDDALFFDVHPLAGVKQFTVEVVFRPDGDGPKAQRFFHQQEKKTENRILFETRITDDKKWFLDTFILNGKTGHTLFAEKHLHPADEWYAATLVVDEKEMRHYVNGVKEISTAIDYQPQQAGETSLGVRINKVFWFKGAVREIRFTPWVLEPKDFLKP